MHTYRVALLPRRCEQEAKMATIVSALNDHRVALSEPEAPLVGPTANITYEFNQNEALTGSSNENF